MKIHEIQWHFMKSDKIFMKSANFTKSDDIFMIFAEIYHKINEMPWKSIKFNEILWNLIKFYEIWWYWGRWASFWTLFEKPNRCFFGGPKKRLSRSLLVVLKTPWGPPGASLGQLFGVFLAPRGAPGVRWASFWTVFDEPNIACKTQLKVKMRLFTLQNAPCKPCSCSCSSVVQ